MDVNRLQTLGLALRREPTPVLPALAAEIRPELDDLRRRFNPQYDELRAVELGESSAYGRAPSMRPLVRGAGTLAEAAPFCGDCHAIRSALASQPCRSCGSTQPPNMSRVNPRVSR